MTAIGFDLRPQPVEPRDGDAAAVLATLYQHLADQDVTAEKLLSIAFRLDEARVEVTMRQPAHEPGYPDLADILVAIVRTCANEQITALQLGRIVFLEEAVVLEVAEESGETTIYMFGVVGL